VGGSAGGCSGRSCRQRGRTGIGADVGDRRRRLGDAAIDQALLRFCPDAVSDEMEQIMTDQKTGVDTCPLVSVCIPTYNRCEQLKSAVFSVMNGTYEHIAIIISDNASSDGTQEWCESICATDSRISYFRHEVNQGPTKNFEFARAKANGKYFMWLGDDDYLSSDYIEVCVAELETDESIALVSGVGVFHSGKSFLERRSDLFQLTNSQVFILIAKYLWLVRDNSIYYGIYRFEMVKGISQMNCVAGDWIWIAEILVYGKARMLDTVVIHRAQGGTTSSSFENIVKVLGAPAWQARYPRAAIAMNLFRYIGSSNDGSKSKKASTLCARSAVILVVFIKMLRSGFRVFLGALSLAKRRLASM
jgi:glycosyltransferase involved in cell wall biosynthesis